MLNIDVPPPQVGVFSATLPPEALDITRKFMNKPVRILVKRDELTLEGIKQVRCARCTRCARCARCGMRAGLLGRAGAALGERGAGQAGREARGGGVHAGQDWGGAAWYQWAGCLAS